MLYKKNLPAWERRLRFAAGAMLVAFGAAALEGALAWVGIASGVGLVLSGLFGFCPACAMVGRRLE
jgi:hypothetical protein